MAKWGEGDPRWICEEREDATNVNNWHWSEKNALEWSQAKLGSLLTDCGITSDAGEARSTTVDSITGEASVSQRKAKFIPFYEIEVKIKWEGTTSAGGKVNGVVFIPNLSDENDPEDLDVQVSIDSPKAASAGADIVKAANKLKDEFRKQITPIFQQQCGKWRELLVDEWAAPMVKNRPAGAAKPVQPAGKAATPAHAVKIFAEAKVPATAGGARDVTLKTVDIKDSFSCSINDLWTGIVDENRIRAYTQSEASFDTKIGGKFSMFGGSVTGVVKDLVPFQRLVLAWRFSTWIEGHFSEATLTFAELPNKESELTLHQTGVPIDDYERTMAGWRERMWERMKAVLGFGVSRGFAF